MVHLFKAADGENAPLPPKTKSNTNCIRTPSHTKQLITEYLEIFERCFLAEKGVISYGGCSTLNSGEDRQH